MQGKDFLFFLIDSRGRSYYVDNGIVKYQGTPKPLESSPDGWQKLQITWERNTNYFGIVRNFSLPLSFVNDGATILKWIFFKKNYEERIFLLVHKKDLIIDLTDNEFDFYYKYLYKGEVDFSTLVQNSVAEGGKVTINIMEGGATKYLKSRQNTTYEFDCNATDLDCIPVRLTGIDFRSQLSFSTFEFEIPEHTNFNYFHTITLPFVFLNEDGDSFGVFKDGQFYELVSEQPIGGDPTSAITAYVASSSNYFFTSIKAVNIELSGELKFENRTFTKTDIIVHTFFVTSLNRKFFVSNVQTTVNPGQTVSFPFNITIDLAANEKLFLMQTKFGFDLFFFLETIFTISLITNLGRSVIYAHRPQILFNKLCKKMSDDFCTGNSLLLTQHQNKVVTSGNAIRQLSTATIKTSFQDFFNAFNVQLNTSLHNTSDEFFIQEKQYFFDTLNVVPLGNVKNMKISIAKEFIANNLKVGYPNQSNVVTTNGKEEFNNTHLYQFPITRITKELNLVSPYRTDGYGIEQIRAQTSGTDKVSNPGDNDTFIIEIDEFPTTIDGVEAYNVKKLSNTAVVTGLFAENTAYNIGLSPKRLLYKHLDYLVSILHGFDGKKMEFQTTEQNALLKTVDGSETIQENADVLIDSNSVNKLFIPLLFEFDVEVPINLVDVMECTPNICFSFQYNGNTYLGFLMKASIEIANNDVQQFTLLSAATNNLNLLING